MRLSLPIFSGLALLLPTALAAATPTTTTTTKTPGNILSKTGFKFDGDAEFNDQAYKNLAALRKVFAGNTPTKTKPLTKGKTLKGGNRRLTNGQRLAMGLPPNPPVKRASKVRRQEPSAFVALTLVTERGLGLGVDVNGGELGFLSTDLASSGQIMSTPDSDAALELSLSYNPTQSKPSNLRIEATSEPEADMPILSLISGRDNLSPNVGPGSWHYLYVGTSEFPGTDPLSPPSTNYNSFTARTGLDSPVETDVWSLDPRTGQLSATWINEDGSAVPVYLYEQAGVLLALADPEAFQAKYPTPITPFTVNIVGKPTARK